MALSFPNPSRSYDEAGHGVRFWGYDNTLEVSFIVEESALAKIDSPANQGEAAFLGIFDANRDRILEAAGDIYSPRRKSLFTLTSADF